MKFNLFHQWITFNRNDFTLWWIFNHSYFFTLHSEISVRLAARRSYFKLTCLIIACFHFKVEKLWDTLFHAKRHNRYSTISKVNTLEIYCFHKLRLVSVLDKLSMTSMIKISVFDVQSTSFNSKFNYSNVPIIRISFFPR